MIAVSLPCLTVFTLSVPSTSLRDGQTPSEKPYLTFHRCSQVVCIQVPVLTPGQAGSELSGILCHCQPLSWGSLVCRDGVSPPVLLATLCLQ